MILHPGLAAHYASWRVMQFALGMAGLIGFIFMFAFFPETSHPNSRGIDKVIRNSDGTKISSGFKIINPFKTLLLLRSPLLIMMVRRAAILARNFR